MGEGGDRPSDSGADDPAILTARLRGKRWALSIVLVVSVAFIVSSAAQIIAAVFGFGLTPLPSGAPEGSAEHACAVGIRSLARALDRAGGRLSSVASAANDDETMAILRPALSPEWDGADAIESACVRSREGLTAWAALQRLRMAEEQSGRLSRDELASVRRDVAAHLPADLR
jgi:hypothetical protein